MTLSAGAAASLYDLESQIKIERCHTRGLSGKEFKELKKVYQLYRPVEVQNAQCTEYRQSGSGEKL